MFGGPLGHVLGRRKCLPKAPWVPPRRLGGSLGVPRGTLGEPLGGHRGSLGIPWPSQIPLGVPRGGRRGPRPPKRSSQGTLRAPQGGGRGGLEGLKGAHKAALEGTFLRRGDIAKSLFLLHEMVHFDRWRGPGEARRRPRGAEETLSEVGRATEAEGRRPRGTLRGAKGAHRGFMGTRKPIDRPSFGALGSVGGPLDMIYRTQLID